MARVNTINFLPKVFQTSTNRRFLGATMDQLASDSINIPLVGYIGRKFAPTYLIGDNYVPENEKLRQDYQLEPSVVITDEDGKVEFNTGFIDLIKNLENLGAFTDNQQRLFGSETYNWDGHFDYDKFVNYFNYLWLPNGPDRVRLYSTQAPYSAEYAVTKNLAVGGFTFTGTGYQPNTQLTLVRGGTYTFTVDQLGSDFFIQSSPGVNGVDPNVSTLSTREVFGVTGNGGNTGTVTFRVPLYNAQDFFILMPISATVDTAVTLEYTDLQNQLLSSFLSAYPAGIDGINNQLQNKTLIFVGNQMDDSHWTTPAVLSQYAALDTASIRPGTVIDMDTRVATWKINLVPIDSAASDFIIQLQPDTLMSQRRKIFVSSGITFAANQFWLTDNLTYQLVPAITANKDRLYYQDGTDSGFVGEIKLVDNISDPVRPDTEIIGKVGYTSPNGVVFTNGLKVQFDDLTEPESYYKYEYKNFTTWSTAILAMNAVVTGDIGGAVAYRGTELVGEWNGTTGYRIREWYVEGVGTSINLVPVGQLNVPETYGTLLTTTPDYLVSNRGSVDRNPWARSNRWFHRDVITASAKYNQTLLDYGSFLSARRPIIEFEPNLQLYGSGRLAKDSVDLLVFTATDAFGMTLPDTRVQGQNIGLTVLSGVTLSPGLRVVFANDYDLNVKNKIWEVTSIAGLGPYPSYINLVATEDNPVEAGETVLVTEGDNMGKTYYFDGADWHPAQSKSGINQPCLFDIVDADGYSFGDETVYPDSTFAGNKFFAYDQGTGNNDVVLGFPLKYQNFNNIGDIVFKQHYNTDTFSYEINTFTGETQTVPVQSGYLVKNFTVDTAEANTSAPATAGSDMSGMGGYTPPSGGMGGGMDMGGGY